MLPGVGGRGTPRTRLGKIRSLPTLQEGGRVTAATALRTSDASAALLIANEDAVRIHGLTSRARIHHMSVLAATGAELMTTLLHELDRIGGRYGLQTMCEGGGQATVTIIERL